MRRIGNEEGMTEDKPSGSTAGGDSLREAVGWVTLEELSFAKNLSGNKEILELVKRRVVVSVTQKEDMVENILCFHNVT